MPDEPPYLTVTQPFGDHERGDRITDPDQIAALLVSHPNSVVKPAPVPQES